MRLQNLPLFAHIVTNHRLINYSLEFYRRFENCCDASSIDNSLFDSWHIELALCKLKHGKAPAADSVMSEQ